MKSLKYSNGIKRGFEAAKAASRHSDSPLPGKKMGAVLMKSGTIIAIGFNQYGKTHPKSLTSDFLCSIHAEHSALLKRQHYSGTTGEVMYVYREVGGLPACSKPCLRCQLFMRQAGVKRVRYINEKGHPEELRL